MLLKNVAKEVVSIKHDGVIHEIEPGSTLDIQKLHPEADIQIQTCLAEKFETETGRKLVRVVETPKQAPKSKPEVAKPVPEKPRRRRRG